MSNSPGVHNEASGGLNGSVVQAGSIDHVSLTSFARVELGGGIVPRQLPLAVRDFSGRAEHLTALDALLPGDDTDGGAGAVVISAVDGAAGMGKTALAVHWAHRVQHRFPDGTLYVDLRGYGPGESVTPGEVLGGFLGALGVSPERIPVEVEAQAGLFRSVVAGRQVLIVLDNAHAVEQVRPLLPGGSGCVVVVTSRASLTGLVIGEGATRITLDLLTEEEALELVRAIIGPRRAEAEPDAVIELIRACARLPLALRIAAGRVATHRYLTIAELVAELGSDRGRWEALSVPADEHTAVRAVFDWSYQRLGDEQAWMFRRLGLHPGPEISLHAAAAVAGLDLAGARRLLDELTNNHLIEPIARDRYRLHDLLRAYAADRAEQEDAPADRYHARRILVEWYAHHAKNALRVITSWEGLHAGAALETHVCPEIVFSGRAEAWAWADLEVANGIATVRAAVRHGLSQCAILLADTIVDVLYLRALWNDAFEICRLGLVAARRIADRTAECFLLKSLGQVHHGAAQWQEAIDTFQIALLLARELGDVVLQALLLSHLGWTCADRGQFAGARKYLRSALPLSSNVQCGPLESFIEFNLSAVCTGLGDYDQAFRHAQRSLELLQRTGPCYEEIYALHYMARARQAAGAHSEAITLCEQALRTFKPDYRDPRNHAFLLDTLGISLQQTGNVARAIASWREALAMFDELGDHRAHDLRERLDALETIVSRTE